MKIIFKVPNNPGGGKFLRNLIKNEGLAIMIGSRYFVKRQYFYLLRKLGRRTSIDWGEITE